MLPPLIFPCYSDESSEEDEGNWPPPGRRKRHPAGNSHETGSLFSDDSQSCISKLMDSPEGIRFCIDKKAKPTGNSDHSNSEHERFGQSGVSSLHTDPSSGFYSRPPLHSLDHPEQPRFSPFVTANPTERSSEELINQFSNLGFNSDPLRTHLDSPSPSTPPMLRRFLNAQSTTAPSECSYSCPSWRFASSSDNSRT